MKKYRIALLAAMLLCLLTANALAIPSYRWDENKVYVISGTHTNMVEIGTANDDEYYLVLDHAVLTDGLEIFPISSSYNQSPTVHLLVKGENQITSDRIAVRCGAQIKLIIEPVSWDASLKIKGAGRGAIDADVQPSYNGFGSVTNLYPEIGLELSNPEFIVPIPSGTAKPVPNTGDDANLILWGGMLGISAVGLIVAGRKVRREY